ncbi:bromodomain-containing protein DDB_G0280777 isoform X1 [Lucilia cuprina]|uniref:bromodomain-containing protein DDB_G0280777 isoform X1 n=1 Tax=Lucilia cuprina TaxID=7375 RepID=UPI001F06F278|nr:bromodomain-containing protein DDB_G0280777 isoform X1 [Lucilia cuprina]
MTEKDTASMTTVQMKADYAASEVYSTASEPPPLGFFNYNPQQQAYKRQSNSVKIAKITAFTIIVSSFILGAFILASSYLQAKASCDQVQALDSVLEKELMLETLQQVNKELPRAEALLGRENVNDDDLQSLDKEEPMKKVEHKMVKAEHHKPAEEESNMNEVNDSENSEEVDEMQKYPGKIPLELDLSDLAAALLQNNKKSRMNCVVERKHAEEIVDSPSKTVALPFGMNLTTDPKKARITGERISIFCEGGNENKDQEQSGRHNNNREEDDDDIEDVEAIRPMFIPFQRVPIPFGAIPNRFPLTHMPQRMEPMMPPRQQEQQHAFLRQLPPPPPPFQQQLPMRPPMPPQEMQAPHPEPQRIVRIQFHQIPIREMIHVANDVPQQISVQQHQQPSVVQQQQQPQQPQQPQPPQVQIQQQAQQQQQQVPQQRQEFPFFQIQRMPLGLALERAGITAEDLNNIQRLTENRINEEFRLLANESDEDETSNSSEDDDDNEDNESHVAPQSQQQNKAQDQQSSEQQQQQQQAERQARMQELPMPIQRLILQPLPEQPRDTMTPPMPDQPMQRLPMGHPGWGRSLAQPVSIPVPMMEAQNDMSAQDDQSSAQTAEESERPHFVQPRSV